ncbi:MAG: hypothetical protein EOP51_19335 [Sphingobacteriales bacterium]|nr:MAG: hypothetical protein EOP51_19335 [Sphingobacteriales bacterium]
MSYSLMMEGRSIEDLHDYINNYQKYWPDAIEAAVTELKNRGEIFTLEEQAEIERRIALRKEASKELIVEEPTVQPKWQDVPMKEEEPKLYSQVAVIGFTIFATVIAGGILMSNNLKQLGNEKGRKLIVLFTVAWFAIEMMVSLAFGVSSVLSIGFNIGSSLVFGLFFWPRYIGPIAYTSKSILKPLAIWILVLLAMYFLMLQMMQMPGFNAEQLTPKR